MATTSSPPPSHQLNPNDWVYLAEGKLHVIVAYHGPAHSPFHTHVLRLLKELHPGEEKAHHNAKYEQQYLTQVVAPALGEQFIDGGTLLNVSREFLVAIATKIAPDRPPRRAAFGVDLTATTVECLRDLTCYFPLPKQNGGGDTHTSTPTHLTIEVKPKAGYRSRSRLVHPKHRALKYTQSRFEIMQKYKFQLKMSEGVEAEWGELGKINLEYSPLDFYSNDRERMRKSLRALLQNPQNFLGMFVNGEPVFGRGKEEMEKVRRAVAVLLMKEGDDGKEREEELLERLMEVVVQILQQEPLLARVLMLQEMDVVDVEGAGMVMRRLVELCEGSEDKALALLEVAELEGVPHHHPAHTHTRAQESKDQASSALIQRLEKVLLTVPPAAAVDGEGCGGSSGSNDTDEHTKADYEQATAAVANFTQEECVLLLQRWLISLGACDCSLMASLRRSEEEREDGKGKHQTATSTGEISYKASPPTKGGGGDGEGEGQGDVCNIAYFMHVVDLGPKPPSKILSKAGLEEKLIELASRPI